MSIVGVETSIVNGIHTIRHEVKRIENGTPPPTSESDVLKKLFHREVESSAQTWSFFDDILMKYLDYAAASAASGGGGGGEEKDELSGASETKESFGDRLTCALVAICLSDNDDLVRFIFDIFAGNDSDLGCSSSSIGTDSNNSGDSNGNNSDNSSSSSSCPMMSLQHYSDVLKTILPRHDLEDSYPLPPAPGAGTGATPASSEVMFPRAVAIQYHSKMHKQLLWPLKVAQEQVKMKFLGVNYWAGLHREVELSAPPLPPSSSSSSSASIPAPVSSGSNGNSVSDGDSDSAPCFLASRAADFSSFVATLAALLHSSALHTKPRSSTKQTVTPSSSSSSSSPPSSPPSSSSDTGQPEIVEAAPGIYTYRHQLSTVGVARGKHASPQKVPVHLHSPIDHILQETFTSTESRRFPFPRHCVSTIGRATPSDMRRELTQAGSTLSSLKMLIIEDSKLQRKMIQRRLSKSEADALERAAVAATAAAAGEGGGDVFPFENAPPPRRISSAERELRKKALEMEKDREGGEGAGLEHDEWTVMEACNGEEALQMIIDTKSSFDVIFVDENLQHSGGHLLGHQFVRILRGHSSVLPTTVIIGFSSNAENYISDFLEAGADAVWQKPMPTPDVIYAEISKYIIARSKSNVQLTC